ncbi:nucleotide sugar dehydrogenase [bacterium]|nr:nucleotide sugar dehydrogenase [bacterium]
MSKNASRSKATPTVGVIGLGYVGLPLVVEMARTGGFNVIGFDVSIDKVESINNGVSYIEDIPTAELEPLVKSGRIRATWDFSHLEQVEAVSICVPTPLRKTKDPDISYILAAVDEIQQHLQRGQTIILESTTYPGTTDEAVLPVLESTGLKVGEDFFLAFSPERVDPGNPKWKTRNTPKIVGGITDECTRRAVKYYGRVFQNVIPVSSTKCAEMVKLLENTFRSVNIGMVNEMALMCDKLGLDVWEVIDAAATKPFGFMPFYPGPGLGGHCIPIDPHYLAWKLKTLDDQARFIEMAAEINGFMPRYVVQKVSDALNDAAKPVNGSRIIVVGVAYKRDVSDVRESPALDIIEMLADRGADVSYYDPHVPVLHENSIDMKSIELTPGRLRRADCIVIVTDHEAVNLNMVGRESKLIVDTRNATKRLRNPKARIVKL